MPRRSVCGTEALRFCLKLCKLKANQLSSLCNNKRFNVQICGNSIKKLLLFLLSSCIT
jgi:hypothetical protein